MVAFSLCLHMVSSLCTSSRSVPSLLTRTSALLGHGTTLMTSINSLKVLSPHTATLDTKASTYELAVHGDGQHTVQSIK